ncbi:MAG: pitrilysin family protein [Bacillota bacterium]
MLAEFQTACLKNGTSVHMLSTQRFKTLTVRVYLQRRLEAVANTRTALVMRLLSRGCDGWPTTRDLTRRFDSLYGSVMGTGVGKSGGLQLAHFHLETPAEQYLPQRPSVGGPAIQTLGKVMTAPVIKDGAFPADATDQEVAYLARDIRGLINDRTRYSVLRCTQEMCQDGPYGLSELGRLEDLDSVDPRNLYSHYQQLMAKGPMDVFAVGHLPPGIPELLAAALDFPRDPAPRETNHVAPRTRAGVREVLEELDIAQARLCLGLRCYVPPAHPDYYALLMYDGILGGFPHSKLFVHVREEAGLAYDVWSFVSAALGFQYIVAGVHPAHYRQALEIIEHQRRQLADGSVSPHELESTRAALISRVKATRDSPSRLIGAAYSGLLTGRTESPEEQVAALSRVALDDVVRVAGQVQLDIIYLLAPEGGTEAASPGRQ